MIGVDTNVLLRLFISDDEIQHDAAKRFFAGRSAADPAFVSFLVVAEIYWLLRYSYKLGRSQTHDVLEQLLASDDFLVEDGAFLAELLNDEARRGDVADELIARSAERAGCSATVTFDRSAAKAIPSMVLLP